MHEFRYVKDELFCEDVRLSELAEKYGTPLYVYSHGTLLDHYRKLKKAFAGVSPLICFSVKSNSSLSLLKTLVREGAGLDIVSGGELFRAQKIKADPSKIVYASVGKTRQEVLAAIRCGILYFNVESIQELGVISDAAQELGKDARVCVRVNPNIDPHTHAYITTGTVESKFGVDLETARIIFLNSSRFKRVRVEGIHVHIGSQITQSAPFVAALKRILRFMDDLKRIGVPVRTLNIGGGLGIIYKEEKPQTAREYADQILPLLKGRKLKLILEPGRFIVGNAGVLLTRVLYLKETDKKRFIIVDAGMNDLARPSLYGAYHQIHPVVGSPAAAASGSKNSDIVGPICESGDFLAKDRPMPVVNPGDCLAVLGAGAYGFSMASNYNSRRRPAEVLVKGKNAYLIRERETYDDLLRNEKVVVL
ncbi:MAG: diaminopimelate decarboxylase [Candidatus Omnitrophota bacterium]